MLTIRQTAGRALVMLKHEREKLEALRRDRKISDGWYDRLWRELHVEIAAFEGLFHEKECEGR